jgi:alginate O-acetyltransferase complex protein AlgI
MTFNSYEFLVFFAVVYGLYLVLDHRWQNRLLLAASYFFYGWWDWRFVFLLALSTGMDFTCGRMIDRFREKERKRIFLIVSVVLNLALLGFFKYFDFFAESLRDSMAALGVDLNMPMLHILLPVGISFYTFQSMGYIIDVYRGHLKASANLEEFAVFVAFFPQLVAGPISRATELLPRVRNPRIVTREKIMEGCALVFWGLFKKIYIADNCAKLVNLAFADPSAHSGASMLVAVYVFAFQIYCDFSGYSDMARGLAKMLGFELMLNFNLPYFSLNPTEFWRRWHISLSTWLKDYVYISLGGNRKGVFKTYRNLFLTMFLGGLWHGAAWNFLLWGTYQGILLIAHRLAGPLLARVPVRSKASLWAWTALRWVVTFHLICLGWLLFRSGSAAQILEVLGRVFLHFAPDPETRAWIVKLFAFTFVLIGVQIFQLVKNDLAFYPRLPAPARIVYVSLALYLLVAYGATAESFIYFQF